MKVEVQNLSLQEREPQIHELVRSEGMRVGITSSIDGGQLITLLIDPTSGRAYLFDTPLEAANYPCLTRRIPACHWQERILWNMFGLVPDGHPRLKKVLLHESYDADFFPLLSERYLSRTPLQEHQGQYQFLEVKGEGVYEIPVGPIHAGIIEPGHFRFSCFGELILNLEIRLGYVHRGIEKKLTQVDWRKGRFVAEAAASDSAAAYALAYSECIESMFSIELPYRAKLLRTLALEIERIGMHLADLAGIAGDIGFLGVASSFQRIRGLTFSMAELLSGQRFLRAFICPGGVVREPTKLTLNQISSCAENLSNQCKVLLEMLLESQGVDDRLRGIGRVNLSLASDFGLVGIAGRASGLKYDVRQFRSEYETFTPAFHKLGDVLARVAVRAEEIKMSIEIIRSVLARLEIPGSSYQPLPDRLPSNSVGLSIVEAHRGELIHLAFTDEQGCISRYCIKDPSVNNWTALAMAVRNNLVADFPLCNKSFSLAYSGHDL